MIVVKDEDLQTTTVDHNELQLPRNVHESTGTPIRVMGAGRNEVGLRRPDYATSVWFKQPPAAICAVFH